MTNEVRITTVGVYAETIPGDMPSEFTPGEDQGTLVSGVGGSGKTTSSRAVHRMLPEEVTGYAFDPQHSWWSIVVPEPTTNLCLNPSFEYSVVTHSFTGWQGTPSAYTGTPLATRGRTCLKMPLAIAADGRTRYTFAAPTANTLYTFSCDVYLLAGMTAYLEFQDGSGIIARRTYTVERDGWNRFTLTAGLGVAGNYFADLVIPFTGYLVDLYTDAWQIEEKGYATTYCDGDMLSETDILPTRSYFWEGEPHDSKSQRFASAAEGGRIVSLTEKIGFLTTSILGLGIEDTELILAKLGSSRQESYLTSFDLPRDFTIIGRIFGCSFPELSKLRAELIRLIRHDNSVNRNQFDLIFNPVDGGGAPYGTPMRIRCQYISGLGGSITNLYQETIPLQFHASDPFIYETFSTNAALTIPPTWTNNGVWYRDQNGTWGTLKAGATTGKLWSCAFRQDGVMMVGGAFTALCGDAVSTLARWDGTNFQQVADLDAPVRGVRGILKGGGSAYNKMFIYGDFTTDVAANMRRLAIYDNILHTLLEPGTGVSSIVYGGTVAPSGVWFIGGGFSTSGDTLTTLNKIAYYDPAFPAIGSIGSGVGVAGFLDGIVFDMVVTRDNYLYIGGTFTADANSNAMAGFCRLNLNLYSGAATLPGGVFEQVSADTVSITKMAVGRDGLIYAFATVNTVEGFWRWTGSTWEMLGNAQTPVDPGIWVDSFGTMWANGVDQDVPGIAQSFYRVVGGDNFLPVDVALDDSVGGYPVNMAFHPDNQILAVWEEETNSAEGNGSYSAAIDYDGSSFVRPTIVLRGPMTMVSVINRTTGAEIWFLHGDTRVATISDDETLFVELSTGRPRIYSDRRGYLVNLLYLPASTATGFWLQPEKTNYISLFVKDADGNSDAYLTWSNRHASIDFSVL